MLTLSDVEIAWSVYLLAAFVLWMSIWRLTGWMWVWVSDPLRAVSAVLLFMPEAVEPVPDHPAPALFAAIFEMLSQNGAEAGAQIAVNLLLVSLFAALGAWVLRGIWVLFFARRRLPATPGFRSRQSGN